MDTKLCLLLLLSAHLFAEAYAEVVEEDSGEEQPSICPLSARFKNLRKYVYQYTAESKNGVTGTANLRNGPRISCQVEIEVPQTCSFVLHTTECILSEVSVIDAQGQPVYRQAAGAEAFQVAMEKNPLNFVVEQVTSVSIYPEKDEPENILNIKRGIISALLVPVLEGEHNKKMSTVHGMCKTDVTINSRKDIDTDVTVVRDLSDCSHFSPHSLPTSPLSLLPGLNGLISKLISSTQTCNYQFDNRRKHMTEAQCTEKHIFIPFSHEGQYGISSEVKQRLTLQDSVKINSRYFSKDDTLEKKLFLEEVEDKLPVQSKDDVLATVRELNTLSSSGKSQQRASLFHKLVSEVRGLKNETLSGAADEMMKISEWLTWQTLFQCGTNECTSAIMQILRTSDESAREVDAIVYALSLLPQASPQRVRDMLSMAQNKPSKAIMYALANTVKQLPQDQATSTPKVKEVAEFMEFMLGDCSGDEDSTFLTLRVIGVMGKYMERFPSLKSSLLNCMGQTYASLPVQKAAIQAFRLMEMNSDVRSALIQQYENTEAPGQKRIAAYLMLMRNPEVANKVLRTLKSEQNEQVKSFVSSHITNILESEDLNLSTAKDYILKAVQGDASFNAMDFTKFSRNYKIEVPLVGSVESNMIFDSANYMPREVMLATTLDNFNAEILEIGLEGEGFEPAIEVLFGENGFFPDTISKAMYWASDKIPHPIKRVLDKWISPLRGKRMKRQVPQDIMRNMEEYLSEFKKRLEQIEDAPKGLAYLRFMGTELGYLKTNELNLIIQHIKLYTETFKSMSVNLMGKLISSLENEVFVHYMFLDKAFTLPTSAGFPLKFSLSGVLAPGAKGGMTIDRMMQQLSFMPSVGMEFVTQMGVYIPEFVVAGIETHTNMYHESAVNAKVTVSDSQIKLSIPAPQGNIQLFSISNKLLSVTSTQTKIVPSMVEDRTDSTECNPIFPGMNYCTILRYSNASLTNNAPYYPLTGETRLALELHPTGEVPEYTATIAYALLREGKEGRHKVDSVKIVLKAESAEPTEATAVVKYNRNKNLLTTDLQIPDYDLEAGIKLAVTDSSAKGKKMRGITIDVTNKDIPQLSLVGHARLESMRDGLIELQLAVPALQVDTSATATLKNNNGLILQLETALNMPETTSVQKAILRYDNNKVELEMKSDINSEVEKLFPNMEEYRSQLQASIDDILDQKVTKTDMKLRHIVSKGLEAVNIWLDKLAAGSSFVNIQRSKRSTPQLILPSLPEKIYIKSDSLMRYQFNKGRISISLPLLLGGKSSAELNIPPTLTLPHIQIPLIGLDIPENNYKIPSFTIPRALDFSLPMLGVGEVSVKTNSNFYDWEGSILGGNNTVDVPSYIAKYKVMASCPVTPLSYKIEGMGMITGKIDDTLKYFVNGSISHCLLDASLSAFETMSMADKISGRTNYRIEASSPLGLDTSVYYSAQSASTSDEVIGDGNFDGFIKVGSVYANSTLSQSYIYNMLKREGKGESTLKFDSSIIQGENVIKGSYVNGELSLLSKTNAQNDVLKHVAELKHKKGQLSVKSDGSMTALGKVLRCKAELDVTGEEARLKVESQADEATHRAYSLLTGSLNSNSLEINIEGLLNFEDGRGTHKGTLTFGANGLTTSCMTTIEGISLTFENNFNGGIDGDGASMSLVSKGSTQENTIELSAEGKISPKEVYITSVFKGNAFDGTARNTLNFGINKQGLSLSNTMMGTLQKMRSECTHTLTVTLWTLAYRSKMDNFICDGASYNHDIKINMRPFITSISANNELEIFDFRLSCDGHLKMEAFKMDAAGSLSGKYGEEDNIKHSCEFTYAELAGTIKCDTTAKVFDSQISNNFDLDFAGLSSVMNSKTQVNCESLRLENNIRTMAMPFSLTIDAILNSDGTVKFYGKHSGQLYSKFLLKAEPLAIAKSHECRASVAHMFLNGESAETHIENKIESFLIPNEQSVELKFKSKLNNHAYNQDVNIYNKENEIGVQFSGVLQTNLLNTETISSDIPLDNQKFSASGFVKYDKNSDCHIIYFPFIESFPAAFESMKNAILHKFESLQNYLNSLDINGLIGRFRNKLDELPQKVNDIIVDMDLENKVNNVKNQLISYIHDYTVSIDDLDAYAEEFKEASRKKIIDLATRIRDLMIQIKDGIESGSWANSVSDFLTQIEDELKAFDEKYEITKTIIRGIDGIEDIIRQIDVQKLQDSSVAWLKQLDAKYEIKTKLQEKLSELRKIIETFDIKMLLEGLRDYIISFDLTEYVEELSDQIPYEDIERVLDSAKDVIVNWIEEYEIPEKINRVYLNAQELILRYEIDKKIEVFVEQAIILVKQYRIQELVQAVVDTLKSIQFEYISDKVMEVLDRIASLLKLMDFKQIIDYLNEHILLIIKTLRFFDYNTFVDKVNEKGKNIVNYINKQINEVYEIPLKIEASREFIKEMQVTVIDYLEKMKNTRIAEVCRNIIDVIHTTVYKDIKLKIQDILEDVRQRVSDMDIRDEILVYLERASGSYVNMIEYISSHFTKLIDEIKKMVEDKKLLNQITQAVEGVLNALKTAEIDVPTFILPFTTLEVPAFKIKMARIHDITIPAMIAIPGFTILDLFSIPSITVDFEKIKQSIIDFIDKIRQIEMPEVDPEAIFGNLRALYLSDLPDFTFSEITLSEIKFPEITVPKLKLDSFEITMLTIPEVKIPEIPFEPCLPAFGKLYGEFKVDSPHYTLMTSAALENTTRTPKSPQFKATLNSMGKSSLEYLDYTLDAMLQIEAPKMRKMVISETVKVSHMALKIDHEASVLLSGPSAEATVKSAAKVITHIYTADLINNVGITLKNGISANMDTTYTHNLNIPNIDVSSQAIITKTAEARFESGIISVTIGTVGSGKWSPLSPSRTIKSIDDYSDEITHKSNLEFTVNAGTAKLNFDGETNSRNLKMKQSVNAESVILSHITIDARAETEAPFIKGSVLTLKGKAQMEDVRMEIGISHNAELIGKVSGSISNACEFLAQPFEVTLDCRNKGNSKIILPLKLTGKIDLQDDFGFTLNSNKQHAFWVSLARFNQYKYKHNFTLDNSENEAGIYAFVDGEANLDFLTVPLSIPEIMIPYLDMKTPKIKEFSLWEDYGLKDLLTTPQQSFDIDFRLLYQKNPDKHTFDLNLKPIYEAFNENAKISSLHFELGRDHIFDALTNSYNKARIQYEKYKIDTSNQPPRYFTVPGYTIPILNIEVSAFRAELPAFSYFIPKEVSTPSFKVPFMGFSVPSYTLVLPSLELPVLHVPETLQDLTLPTFTIPEIQNNIMIPAFGNMTYEFSIKSPIITLNANGGLYNQSDIVIKFDVSSTSVFDVLKAKLDGSTTINKRRGLKMATSLSLVHMSVECTHESTVSLTKRNMEASLTNLAKIKLPVFTMNLNQVVRGNTKSKPNIASNVKVSYTYNLPIIETQGTGSIDHNFALEALSSYFSLESTWKGTTDATIMECANLAGSLDNEATIYVNANGLRSTLKTDVTSKVYHQKAGSWNMDVTKDLALEATLRRIYATMTYTSTNAASIASFSTNGKQNVRLTLEFVPLTTFSANLDIDLSQPSNLGHAGIVQNADLSITSDKQKLLWSGKEQLATLIHSSDLTLSNDQSEIRMEMSESIEGNVAFLKSIKLPVYHKSLWDIFKFGEVTSTDQLQFLNVSTVVIYTKSMEGTLFALPTKLFENGVTFNFPQTTMSIPNWLKEIPQMIRQVDMRFEKPDLPDYISIPPVIAVPEFTVPFTTLHVPSFVINLTNLEIPNEISTPNFDIILPGFPKVEIPSINAKTKYLKDKMAHLFVSLPEYEITISPFNLPKAFDIGEYPIRLDDITKTLYHFELPTIIIPEQKIEVPEISLHLPAGVFIPTFGALSATVKMSAPVYNNTWTGNIENTESGIVCTMKSTCTSTMVFLEYNLDVIGTIIFENGALGLDGKSTFTHRDVNINWKHDLSQNLRMKREESSVSSPSRHTLGIDIVSQTFADMSFRYASHNNGITSSISSPAAGFIGFQFTRRSPSQFYAKLFSRYLSTPDKDTDLMSFKVTLKNSEKLSVQVGYQINGLSDMINGLKDRLPSIIAALHKFINQYHIDHLGMDLNRAALKLKNALSNGIDRAYQEIPRMIDALQTSVEQLRQQGKNMWRRTLENLPQMDLQELSRRFSSSANEYLLTYESNMRVLLDAAMKFLKDTKFHLPGLEAKLTGEELYNRTRQSISKATDRATTRFFSLMEAIADSVSGNINKVEFTLAGTTKVISGKNILKDLRSAMKSAKDQIMQAIERWDNFKLEKMFQDMLNLVRVYIQRAEVFLNSLRTEKLENISSHINGIYKEAGNLQVTQKIREWMREAKKGLSELRDFAKSKVQELYNEISMKNLSSNLNDLLMVVESHINSLFKSYLTFMKSLPSYTEPYVRVSNKKTDVDIPLPFYWKSFSEWPSMA
ncbi:apolipoprotein B-100 [Rhinichthys klamathensis goyatoka]|uniref:apolipoprotein B-100 n=1 Tax=Rhinichthys klamathensis goyatoka TaxID=3034132 RepID=UPI0024B4BC4C|nr:apolipoprotein B-100 [Rhinichthys klamathensis goyatoka]